METRLSKRTLAAFSAACCFTALATTLRAHDFFIVPDVSAITSGGTISALGHNTMHFPKGESLVAHTRIDMRAASARRVMRASPNSPCKVHRFDWSRSRPRMAST